MCIRRETREKARRSLAFSRVSKPHTHITHMLRQCTCIVYKQSKTKEGKIKQIKIKECKTKRNKQKKRNETKESKTKQTNKQKQSNTNVIYNSGRHGRDRMVVGFTTTCAISAYHH